jgi:rhodanese-related sulfurtransferase
MLATRTLKDLPFEEALAAVDGGAAFIDLRRVDAYLEVHIPESLCLLYEWGPGMASRARDCLPLDLPLLLMEIDEIDYLHAAASLRGKGFTVLGKTADPINEWAAVRGVPVSTEVVHSPIPGSGTVLDVGDPGAEKMEDAMHIPIESLWHRIDEIKDAGRVAVLGGYGVRAALAVGILERAGIEEIFFWSEQLTHR